MTVGCCSIVRYTIYIDRHALLSQSVCNLLCDCIGAYFFHQSPRGDSFFSLFYIVVLPNMYLFECVGFDSSFIQDLYLYVILGILLKHICHSWLLNRFFIVLQD